MKMLLTAAAAALLLSACGSDAETTATDPAGDTPASPAAPAAVPAAPGAVATRDLALVRDDGAPVLCLGPVAESDPPQCSGPELVGWSWRDHRPMFERSGGVTWGSFAVTGTFDGTAFTVQSAVPAALYDAMVQEPVTHPAPAVAHTEDELAEIQDAVGQALPGVQSTSSDGERVLVEVTYDDGSLQDWADSTYGKDVVVVTPLLVDQLEG